MIDSPLLRIIEKRIAEWTQLPVEHGEAFYLIRYCFTQPQNWTDSHVRYQRGQQYLPHNDYFSNDKDGASFIGTSGNRVATVLTYISSPEQGGETIFPNAVGGKISGLKLLEPFCFSKPC